MVEPNPPDNTHANAIAAPPERDDAYLRKRITGLEEQLAQAGQEILQLEQARNVEASRAADLQDRLSELVEQLERSLHDIRGHKLETQRALQQLAKTHASYRNSTSWKLTAPLRAMGSQLALWRASQSADEQVERKFSPSIEKKDTLGGTAHRQINIRNGRRRHPTFATSSAQRQPTQQRPGIRTTSGEAFRYLISVGHNCGTAYQIQLHTGLREAYFFDWLFSPIESVARTINANFRDVFLRENLQISRAGKEVVDLHYGLRLNHSFKVNGVGLVVPELLERDLRAERDKFNFMAGKFLSALRSDDRCAFIRYNPFTEKSEGASSIEKLRSALLNQAGNPRTTLIVVENSLDPPSTIIDDNLVHMKINEIPARSTSYHGRDFILTDDVAWSEVFASLPINLVGRKSRRT